MSESTVGGGPPPIRGQAQLPPGVPTQYADNIVNVIWGLSTSKLVLGVEAGPNMVNVTAVLVMPTPALVAFAHNVVRATSAEPFIQESKRRFEGVTEIYRNGPPLPPKD